MRLFRPISPIRPAEDGTPSTAKRGISGRSVSIYAAISTLVLLPCFWQPRLQAGDLSSHIYNAWLVQLIEAGRLQGLSIARQTTNVLFDLMLSGLFRLFGAELAQRIAVSIAVLVFVWGAFAFVSKVAGHHPWHLLICIAMLAYGWVFHMGFFNFYLSMGLCFWALSLVWESGKRWLTAIPILAVAYMAHGLPVVWTGGLILYLFLARRVPARRHALLTAGTLAVMIVVHVALDRNLVTHWSHLQLMNTTGLDQVWVFDMKYYYVLIGLLVIWGLLFLELVRRTGARQVASSMAFQICVISALGVFIMPSTVLLPGFQHSLVYIAERMSLGVGICVCALLGMARARTVVLGGLTIVAVVFFSFLFRDERALNSFEDRMEDTVAKLEPGQRVLSGVDDNGMHCTPIIHMIDRVCLGRCFSYANYEASTAQFRVRADEVNPYVAFRYRDSVAMQRGWYLVKAGDLPMVKVDLENNRLVINPLKAGIQCGIKFWNVLADVPRS